MINIMNLTNSGNHSILIVIVKYLLMIKNEGISITDLKKHLIPDGNNDDLIDKTIRRWTTLELFITNNEVLTISENDYAFLRENSLQDLIETRLKNIPTDFYYALCWLFSQDIFEIKNWEDIENRIDHWFGNNHEYKPFSRNSANWSGFIPWASYLRFIKVINGKVYLDMSERMLKFIKTKITAENCEIMDFFNSLGDDLPFLWPGALYNTYRNNLQLPNLNNPPLSLSISLQLLENRVVEFKNLHDFPHKVEFKSNNRLATHLKIKR